MDNENDIITNVWGLYSCELSNWILRVFIYEDNVRKVRSIRFSLGIFWKRTCNKVMLAILIIIGIANIALLHVRFAKILRGNLIDLSFLTFYSSIKTRIIQFLSSQGYRPHSFVIWALELFFSDFASVQLPKIWEENHWAINNGKGSMSQWIHETKENLLWLTLMPCCFP